MFGSATVQMSHSPIFLFESFCKALNSKIKEFNGEKKRIGNVSECQRLANVVTVSFTDAKATFL